MTRGCRTLVAAALAALLLVLAAPASAQTLPPCGSEQMEPELADVPSLYASHTYRVEFRLEERPGTGPYRPVNVQVTGPPGVVGRVSVENEIMVLTPQTAGTLTLTMSWDQQDDSDAAVCSSSTTLDLPVQESVPITIKRTRHGRSAYLESRPYAFGILFSLAPGELDQYDDYEVDAADHTPIRVEARAVAGTKRPGVAVEPTVLEYVPGARGPRRAKRGLVSIVRRDVYRLRGLETIEIRVATRRGLARRALSISLTQGARVIGSFAAAGRCLSSITFGSPITSCDFKGRHSWLWPPCRPVEVKGRFIGCFR